MAGKRVGIAQVRFGAAPEILYAAGLGSCVGVGVWSCVRRMGALAHVMLPRKEEASADHNPLKFADQAVSYMVRELCRRGCDLRDLVARMAGGATMFAVLGNEGIGGRNAETVRQTLRSIGVDLRGEDIGGCHGRTVTLYTEDGRMKISSRACEERWI